MYTEDDLRASLDTLEGEAPDTATVLSGLSRVRTRRVARRRTTVVVAAAVLAAAVAGGSVIVTNHDPAPRTGHHATPPRGAPEWFRFPFSIDGLPGYTVTYRFANATGMSSAAWVAPGDGGDFGTNEMYVVHTFPQGKYDPARELTGEPVTVNGGPAFYLGGAQCQCSTSIGIPEVAWEYAPDTWALVQYPRPGVEPGFTPPPTVRETLLTIANAVRFDWTEPVRVPFRVGYLPASLRPTGPVDANVNTVVPGSKGVMLGYVSANGPVTIMAGELGGTDTPVGEPTYRKRTIGGEPEVVVNVGGYTVSFSAEGVSEAELMKIARSISGVADLHNPHSWVDAEDALQPS